MCKVSSNQMLSKVNTHTDAMEIPHFFPGVASIISYWTKASFTDFPTKSRVKTISKAIYSRLLSTAAVKRLSHALRDSSFCSFGCFALDSHVNEWPWVNHTHGWRLSLESWLTRWIMQPVESPSHQSSCLNTARLQPSIGTRGGVCFYGYQSGGVFWILFPIFGLREFSWSTSQ